MPAACSLKSIGPVLRVFKGYPVSRIQPLLPVLPLHKQLRESHCTSIVPVEKPCSRLLTHINTARARVLSHQDASGRAFLNPASFGFVILYLQVSQPSRFWTDIDRHFLAASDPCSDQDVPPILHLRARVELLLQPAIAEMLSKCYRHADRLPSIMLSNWVIRCVSICGCGIEETGCCTSAFSSMAGCNLWIDRISCGISRCGILGSAHLFCHIHACKLTVEEASHNACTAATFTDRSRGFLGPLGVRLRLSSFLRIHQKKTSMRKLWLLLLAEYFHQPR